MTIYAIFLCLAATGGCQPASPAQYVNGMYIAPTTYDSLEECRADLLQSYAGNSGLDDKGRYVVGQGEWYVCLSRHVDTWEDPQN